VRTPAFASGHVRTLAPHAGCVRRVTKPVLVQLHTGSGRPVFEDIASAPSRAQHQRRRRHEWRILILRYPRPSSVHGGSHEGSLSIPHRKGFAASLDSAFGWDFVAHPGSVAQGIEQRFPKPCVAGSNPAGATHVVFGRRRVADARGQDHGHRRVCPYSRDGSIQRWTCSSAECAEEPRGVASVPRRLTPDATTFGLMLLDREVRDGARIRSGL
jgi:hypothetical protein